MLTSGQIETIKAMYGDVHPVDQLVEYIESLHGQLAECYRLTGADPDGNEDWRLAPQAVVEVRRLREDYNTLELPRTDEQLRAVGWRRVFILAEDASGSN